MDAKSQTGLADGAKLDDADREDPLGPLVERQFTSALARALPNVVVGELLGVTDDGRTPLVIFHGQHGSGAVRARTTVDLHGTHVGGHVLLVFEEGDATRPIVIGALYEGSSQPLDSVAGTVEVDVDGKRLVVSAKQELVLRCGKARITLTLAGKVLIEGAYISSRSSGVNRIRGGSIQLN